MGWTEFILAMAAFLGSHMVPSRPGLRGALVARLGRAGYGAAYGLLSLVLLIWVIAAAGRAPFVPLWDQAIWMRWLANLAMPVALLLVALALGAANPLSFGGRASGFDPARPGVAGLVRHPLLWALLIWSGVHLVVNGDLAHVILFGLFAGFSALGMLAIDARNRRLWGAGAWAELSRGTSNLPFAGDWRGWRPEWWRIGLAIVVWAVLWHLHEPVIGVSPQP
ncbi:putative membrane protein [Gemmobacter caeni]|uniref:Putative membrane protein n=1 Tax=Gemmobacter caeni TaxID=589035 RepID=A0A2T6BBA2_9RHOB|nr:NnrU family protein [Gemmobacter caeni]PTX53296.1 putative membrane protein [Gemmobacter caeni]TWJ05407.1 putative membrane protein [Gemmobacter caeni]